MTSMSNPEASQGARIRPLRPSDLFDQAAEGAAISLSIRVLRVIPRTTTAGLPWAIVDGAWRGHELRCVAFPAVWAQVEKPQPRDLAVIQGTTPAPPGVP